MKKIAVIHDLSGLGKCSLTAAIPVISAMGVQACPFPTAILSNQTGYESCFIDDYTEHMDSMMEEWKKRGFTPDGIYAGFLANEDQAEKVLAFLDSFRNERTQVLVDPIMGDHGQVFGFCTEGFLSSMRRLAERASILTPNLTEAMILLYGREGMKRRWEMLEGLPAGELKMDVEMLGEALSDRFGLEVLAVTGIIMDDGQGNLQMGNLIREKGQNFWVISEKTGGSYSGTGDIFASVLAGGLVKGLSAKDCAEKAVRLLHKAIQDTVAEGTDRNEGVCFEPHLHELWED